MPISTPLDSYGHPLEIYALGAAQNVAFNAAGGASTQSTAFGVHTEAIIVCSVDADVRIAIGLDPTAAATSTLLPQSTQIILNVPSGGKIAVLGNSTPTGALSVTEVSERTLP